MNILFLVSIFLLNVDLELNLNENKNNKSITILSGTLNLSDGTTINVGKGTFIPSPLDMELARKIIFQQSEIDILNERIKSLTMEIDLRNKHYNEMEEEMRNWYEEKYKSLRIENESLKSWWNEWGSIFVWSVGSAAASALVTYWAIK
jgi:uncharacterized coiled-coil protein SlyX